MTAITVNAHLHIDTTVNAVGWTEQAALQYAYWGFFVLPVRRGKHAGSYVGKGWPDKSSRDPAQILRWFTDRPDLAIALHVGRSGAIAFDVDTPENMPPLLADAIAEHQPPFQSTRADHPGRGHYLFALPPGVMLGNGLGQLATDPEWGEVRGRNGIIMAAPTIHPKADRGGQYKWRRGGTPPRLPAALERALVNRRPPVRHEPRVCSPVYTHQWIRGIVTRLLNAEDKQQNKLLFWAACRFGEMVAAGVISEQTAYDTLIDVGMRLPNHDPTWAWAASDITSTVTSGLAAGQDGGRR